MGTKRVTMTQCQSGPAIFRAPGRTYDVDADEADRMVAGGMAVYAAKGTPTSAQATPAPGGVPASSSSTPAEPEPTTPAEPKAAKPKASAKRKPRARKA